MFYEHKLKDSASHALRAIIEKIRFLLIMGILMEIDHRLHRLYNKLQKERTEEYFNYDQVF